MNLSPDIRVRAHRYHHALYKQMLEEMHELFFLCACVGFTEKKSKPLGKDGEDRFWSGTFTPDEWNCFYAMVLAENDMDFTSIQEDRKVLARMEELANGGMDVLLQSLLQDYVIDTGTALQLDSARTKELPKVLLGWLRERAAAR